MKQHIKKILILFPLSLLLSGCFGGLAALGKAFISITAIFRGGRVASQNPEATGQVVFVILVIAGIAGAVYYFNKKQKDKPITKATTVTPRPVIPKQEEKPKEKLSWDEPPKVEEKKVEPIKTEVTITAEEEEKIYADVARELKDNRREGLWTKGFAECGGDEKKTKLYYVKNRVKALMEELKETKRKE
jgi:hypothetical protein